MMPSASIIMMMATTASMARTTVLSIVMMNDDGDGDDYDVDGIALMFNVETVDHQHQLCGGDEHCRRTC